MRSLETALSARGFQVLTASTGLDGLRSVFDHRPAAVILDLGLPDIDGLELVKMIRAVSEVPDPRCDGTGRGSGHHPHARCGSRRLRRQTLFGRSPRGQVARRLPPHRNAGRLPSWLSETSASTRRRGWHGSATTRSDLTRKEFDLLAFLASQPGHVVSKREILAAVWDQPLGGADKTVDVHLSWLRRKLGESAAEPHYVHVLTRRRSEARRSPRMRRRLNLTVLAVTAMVTLAFIIPLGAVVRIVASDRALSAADQEARTLAGVLASENSRAALQSVVGQLNADGSGRQVAVFTTGECHPWCTRGRADDTTLLGQGGPRLLRVLPGNHARLGSRPPPFGNGCRGRERAGQPPHRGGVEGMACPRRGRRGHPWFGPPPLRSAGALSGSIHRGPRHGDPTPEHR